MRRCVLGLVGTGCGVAAAADEATPESTVIAATPGPVGEASSTPFPSAGLSDVPDPQALACQDDERIDNCYWERLSLSDVSESGYYLYKTSCGDGDFHVLSGGCNIGDSAGRLVRSNPYENNDSNNLPEDNEAVSEADGVTGWACVAYLPAGAGMTTVALCCDSVCT